MDKENAATKKLAPKMVVKRDFFGRVIVNEESVGGDASRATGKTGSSTSKKNDEGRVWITYHEGFSNAVRKPITLRELMEGL